MEAMSTARAGERPAIWTAALVAAILFCSAAYAQSVVVPVPGTSNPYLAGMPNGSLCCSGDAAPAQSPAQVTGLPLTAGATLTFSATGGVTYDPVFAPNGPDGGFVFTTSGSNGISGATWPVNALVGVFLDNGQPDLTPAPAALDFSAGAATAFTSLSPALKQAFFIGDGLTGTGSGSVQTFVIPAGATRLYLGTADGVGWFNNAGSFSVTVSTSAAPPPPASPANIPALSTPLLAALTLMLFGFAVRAMRRR